MCYWLTGAVCLRLLVNLWTIFCFFTQLLINCGLFIFFAFMGALADAK